MKWTYAAALVAASIAAPVIATLIRRRDDLADGLSIDDVPFREFTFIEDLPGQPSSTGPAVWEWYQNHLADIAGRAELTVPCKPIDCPPVEEIHLDSIQPFPPFTPPKCDEPGCVAVAPTHPAWRTGWILTALDGWRCPEHAAAVTSTTAAVTFGSLIGEYIAQFEPKAAVVIEIACEQAIQTGYMGVKVHRGIRHEPSGDAVMYVEAQATPEVPFGWIDEDGRRYPMGIKTTEDDA